MSEVSILENISLVPNHKQVSTLPLTCCCVAATYSLEQIHRLINSTHFLNVSYIDPSSPFPMTLPMIGQMGSFDRPSASIGDVLDLYLHGYVSSRVLNLARKNTDGTADEGAKKGLPITVSATHVDGLILALTPHNHSYNYRSAVLFGHAELVTDDEEKLYAMELITSSVVPNRWANSRLPPTKTEMTSTGVLKVKIHAGSAKIRVGMPGENKFDLEDDSVTSRVWTGVVPVWTQLGEPLVGPANKVAKIPDYISEYIKDENSLAKETALEQAKKE
jgi:uncharacterized protein